MVAAVAAAANAAESYLQLYREEMHKRAGEERSHKEELAAAAAECEALREQVETQRKQLGDTRGKRSDEEAQRRWLGLNT